MVGSDVSKLVFDFTVLSKLYVCPHQNFWINDYCFRLFLNRTHLWLLLIILNCRVPAVPRTTDAYGMITVWPLMSCRLSPISFVIPMPGMSHFYLFKKALYINYFVSNTNIYSTYTFNINICKWYKLDAIILVFKSNITMGHMSSCLPCVCYLYTVKLFSLQVY